MTMEQANKFQKHCARMRTDMELVRKSEKVPKYEAQALEEEIRYILVSRLLIYPSKLQKRGLNLDSDLDQRKEALGIEKYKKQPTDAEERLIKMMKYAQEDARKSNWQFRIAQETIQKQKEGWYPFFITLTIDPMKHDPEEFWKDPTNWQKYLRSLSKVVTDELGEDPFWQGKYRPMSNYLTYAAVIEHGKSKKHHHLHALVWMREIPDEWKQCPNRRCVGKYQVHNRCSGLETFWKHGRREVNYYRTIDDIWQKKHGFVLPLKDGKPMKVAPAEYAGAYITKYLQKEHKQWKHRMKATRNLGMKKLKETIAKMSDKQVEALTWRAENPKLCHSLSLIHTVPLGLVRQEAKQRNFYNQYKRPPEDWETKLMMIPIKPFITMLRSVRDGVRPERMLFEEFYEWVSRCLPVQKGYCEDRLKEAHEILRKDFKRNPIRVKPVKLGANDIGHI